MRRPVHVRTARQAEDPVAGGRYHGLHPGSIVAEVIEDSSEAACLRSLDVPHLCMHTCSQERTHPRQDIRSDQFQALSGNSHALERDSSRWSSCLLSTQHALCNHLDKMLSCMRQAILKKKGKKNFLGESTWVEMSMVVKLVPVKRAFVPILQDRLPSSDDMRSSPHVQGKMVSFSRPVSKALQLHARSTRVSYLSV